MLDLFGAEYSTQGKRMPSAAWPAPHKLRASICIYSDINFPFNGFPDVVFIC